MTSSTAPVPDARTLRELLGACWSRETSSLWSAEVPSRGQRGVTARVLHDHFGGEIVKTRVGAFWRYYNRPAGIRLDATADRFPEPIVYLDLAPVATRPSPTPTSGGTPSYRGASPLHSARSRQRWQESGVSITSPRRRSPGWGGASTTWAFPRMSCAPGKRTSSSSAVRPLRVRLRTSAYGVEWMRFEKHSPVPERLQTVPHLAFDVDDLDAAFQRRDVLLPPGSPSEGARATVIVRDGAPIELIWFDAHHRAD